MIRIKENGKFEFIFDHACSQQVYIVGDFNGWNEHSLPMQCENGQWQIELELSTGEYEYKYLAGTVWYNDYHAHKYVDNPWGGENSVVIVK